MPLDVRKASGLPEAFEKIPGSAHFLGAARIQVTR